MGLQILIAEDDLTLQPLWSAMINKSITGAKIIWSVSSEEAQKIIQSHQQNQRAFDVIISDIFLAGSETGINFLSSDLVKNTSSRKILISAVDAKQVEQTYKHLLPGTLFLSKPLSIDKFRRVLVGPHEDLKVSL
jgi:response regulator of citrate/malate metabolism